MKLERVNKYYDERFFSEPLWETATGADRQRAADTAEKMLSAYKPKLSSKAFFNAVCEQALFLLRHDKRSLLQQAGVRSFSVGNISETFGNGGNGRPPHIAPTAWAYIRGTGVKMGTVI